MSSQLSNFTGGGCSDLEFQPIKLLEAAVVLEELLEFLGGMLTKDFGNEIKESHNCRKNVGVTEELVKNTGGLYTLCNNL